MSLTYGPREDQLLKELDKLGEKNIIPENKNEILRRGLHAYKYLAQADETILLDLLSEYLHLASKDIDPRALNLARTLAYVTYATMVSKYGAIGSEMFESIPLNLDLIEQTKKEVKGAKIDQLRMNISKNLSELANGVDIIFRKRLSEPEWSDKSRRGEVCGLIGCRDKPTTRCDICSRHYCYRDLRNHRHIMTDTEIEERRKTTEQLK
jgi:hypothetical protein